jgi:putative heme transporter
VSDRAPALPQLGPRQVVQSLLGLAAVGLLIAYGLPYLLDTSWDAIGAQLARVRPGTAVLMGLLLLGGLFCYTWVVIGSLPGVTHLQALKINASAATVANLVPLGAALGVAVSWMMLRSWGFSRSAVSSSFLVTALWNVLARVLLPVVGCLVVVAGPIDAPQIVVTGAALAGAIGTVMVVLCAVMIFSDRVAAVVSRVLRVVLSPFSRAVREDRGLDSLVTDQRARVEAVVRSGWWRMTLGMTGQFVLLFGLYWVAARTVGLDLPVAELFCAYTFRQFLTVMAVTPGGLGVTEVGTAGLLVLFGADGGAASATALLYAIYAHLMVVPFGLAAMGSWWASTGRRASVEGRLT